MYLLLWYCLKFLKNEIISGIISELYAFHIVNTLYSGNCFVCLNTRDSTCCVSLFYYIFTEKENDKECGGIEECLYGGAVCEEICKCPELYKLMGTTCIKSKM
jgi:hypothetical protein